MHCRNNNLIDFIISGITFSSWQSNWRTKRSARKCSRYSWTDQQRWSDEKNDQHARLQSSKQLPHSGIGREKFWWQKLVFYSNFWKQFCHFFKYKTTFFLFQFKVEMMDDFVKLAKYRYECGNYSITASYLYFYMLVMPVTDKVLIKFWI